MSGITLVVEDSGWRSYRGLQARLKEAAGAARRAVRLRGDFTILLAGDAALRRLNRNFRGKDKPTNVLSFPGGDDYAGDIAIAYGVTKKQAKAAGKSIADHASHLVVHGVLHLAGHDHERPRDAKIMEPLEVKILARLGIADPYGEFAAMSEHPSFLKRLVHRLTGEDASSAAIRESLEEVIEESDRESASLSAQERVMLGNLLSFGALKVGDIMVPRAEIIAVDETIGLADLLMVFREAQHSRLPLYRETLDDPTGLIHVKDVLGLLEASPEGAYCLSPRADITGLRRPILFAPPSMRALDMLLKMQASHTHLALVIDEYGGTDGLVSIEDIIEEIVGDIADEHDEDGVPLKSDDDGFIADARTELDDFKAQTGHDLMLADSEDDVDSLGGLVTSLLGRVPQRGEIVTHPGGYEFLVLDADPRRVRKLRVKLPPSP